MAIVVALSLTRRRCTSCKYCLFRSSACMYLPKGPTSSSTQPKVPLAVMTTWSLCRGKQKKRCRNNNNSSSGGGYSGVDNAPPFYRLTHKQNLKQPCYVFYCLNSLVKWLRRCVSTPSEYIREYMCIETVQLKVLHLIFLLLSLSVSLRLCHWKGPSAMRCCRRVATVTRYHWRRN